MHLLVTRAEADAAAFSAQLEALGHIVSLEPLLRVDLLPIPDKALEGASALVLTSRNAVRALSASPYLDAARRLPLFAVGPGTAQLARDAGFTDVTVGSGSGADLVPVIVDAARTLGSPLVHIRGQEIAFDLKKALGRHRISLREVQGYRSVPADAFRPHIRDLLADGEIDAVVLMSPRTGATFASLVADAGLREPVQKLAFLCLSPAVAATIEPLSPARVEVADSPNSAAMLDAVTRVATLWSGV